jgi:hypothetical protein
VQRLAATSPPHAIFRIGRSLTAGKYEAQKLRAAPNVPAQYQSEGGWKVTDAPEGLPDGGFVLVSLGTGREGKFVDGVGKFQGPYPPQQRGSGPPRSRR